MEEIDDSTDSGGIKSQSGAIDGMQDCMEEAPGTAQPSWLNAPAASISYLQVYICAFHKWVNERESERAWRLFVCLCVREREGRREAEHTYNIPRERERHTHTHTHTHTHAHTHTKNVCEVLEPMPNDSLKTNIQHTHTCLAQNKQIHTHTHTRTRTCLSLQACLPSEALVPSPALVSLRIAVYVHIITY